MFRFTQEPSWSYSQCLAKITSVVQLRMSIQTSLLRWHILTVLKGSIWDTVQISNQELWARAKQRLIELEIRQRKWGWLGHTLRRPPGDVAKAALEWNPQGTRLRGRPRTAWRRTILEEIRHQDKTWKEVKVLTKNRVRWRNFVRALCSLEEWWETIYIYEVWHSEGY